ncbi:hypothetical protein VP01_3130g1 [Puccinia sorghi]|uniref:Uncharacterized protein n=1 Tax=Puccinia sorghi TaxID=27349 RepID=A0A0L6UZ21_9BASI|nr:hypothetical protein VP01_3130g1 [Puccinia sorghi]
MDPSHNAWASSTEQSWNLPNLQAPAKVKKAALKSKAKTTQTVNPQTTSTSKKKDPAEKAPQRGLHKTSAPPVFLSNTPTKVRKPPHETAVIYTNKGDILLFTPLEFQSTALFVHIKILWGHLKQDLVPKPPQLSTLEEFYKQFCQAEQIKDAVKSGSTNYVRQHEIQCFQNVQRGQVKCGNSIIHLGSRFVTYAQGLMSRLGLRVCLLSHVKLQARLRTKCCLNSLRFSNQTSTYHISTRNTQTMRA